MSRRSQKRISTDGADDSLRSPAFSDLDSLAGEIPLARKKPEPGGSGNPKKSGKKPKSKGRVNVRREKAGRGGKTVTTLSDLPNNLPVKTLEAMVFDLKKQCACGGTLKGRVIELQGDVVGQVCQILADRGYQAVRAGG